MTQLEPPLRRPKIEPGFSPKPAVRTQTFLAEEPSPSPSPSPSEEPETPSPEPNGRLRKG